MIHKVESSSSLIVYINCSRVVEWHSVGVVVVVVDICCVVVVVLCWVLPVILIHEIIAVGLEVGLSLYASQ